VATESRVTGAARNSLAPDGVARSVARGHLAAGSDSRHLARDAVEAFRCKHDENLGREGMSMTGTGLISSINSLSVPAGAMGYWWLGQGSAGTKLGGQLVWLDPYLDPDLDARGTSRRLMAPPVAPEEVTNATVVLLTHDHRGHIDPVSLPGIAAASPSPQIIAPNPHLKRVNDLIGQSDRNIFVKAGQRVKIGGLEIIPVPAAHERLDEDSALGHPYLGYVLKIDGLTVYCAGDTVI